MIDKLPAKAQQILVGWLAAWPTLTLILYGLQPFSADWPLPMRSLASATGMALLMNLVSVPLVRRWLAFNDRSRSRRTEPRTAENSVKRSTCDAR